MKLLVFGSFTLSNCSKNQGFLFKDHSPNLKQLLRIIKGIHSVLTSEIIFDDNFKMNFHWKTAWSQGIQYAKAFGNLSRLRSQDLNLKFYFLNFIFVNTNNL